MLNPVRQNPRLLWSFVATSLILAIWSVAVIERARRTDRQLTLEIVLRKQHYLQACAQGSVLLYWGWYWTRVYESASLIAAQLLFAYAFDLLLSWSRRDSYSLGFAPFPVIFSINLFLWFRPEWFFLQFLMVAVGFAAKDLIRWDKDGRRTHIFNPSSFPLALFSLALIMTGMSDATFGREIAITQFYPPHIYLFLFLIGLPGQYFFGVTTMTMSAAVTTYVFGLLYFAVTGTYFFYDSYIPIAVFLGMHLLFTDPSTSPRTELGRIMFGVAYGLSTVLLYRLLSLAGVPAFYDKLLQVPLLNLSIKGIDRVARSSWLRGVDPARIAQSLAPRQRHLAYIGVWITVFGIMSAVQGVGDNHRGQWVPFWQHACAENRAGACDYLALTESNDCDAGSGWACNAFAILQTKRDVPGPGAGESFGAGCRAGFSAACENRARLYAGSGVFADAAPTLHDYAILVRGSKATAGEGSPASIYSRACGQGWTDACDRSGSSAARGAE
ncbi:MAG: hypothetical protein DMF92_05325 [Acidobacteria bacterium]|nr:MAG: hypothetical protein DMF92_05325 [Acidobacteriota bacterium]